MKRYHENEDNLSNQRKLYNEKNRDVFLAKSKLNQLNRNYERNNINNKVKNSIKSYKI